MTRHREIVMVDPQTDQGPRISFKHPLLRAWMRFGLFLGNIMGWIILSLFYVLIITPYGLVFRLFRVDPLGGCGPSHQRGSRWPRSTTSSKTPNGNRHADSGDLLFLP